ncbi:DUF4190 domain-containing protein [Cellulomonas sp. RIT-PI-Y]|uniref:DUF4190 domain-containing protein n=1 Tax=Cellulomonas sp. RIT-PI-Y TaxID=3035297 RepID=UPI0021D9B810|nr:DUF4190 domain-containing protein [Cellulomonas sp. RIT-PI-Y]
MSTDDGSTRPDGSPQPDPESPPTAPGQDATSEPDAAPTEQTSTSQWSRPTTTPETAAYGTPGYGQQPSGDQTAAYGTPAYGQQPGGDQTAAHGTPAYGQQPSGDQTAAYGTPAYGQPSSGETPSAPSYGSGTGDAPAPGYSAPGYSAPGYGTPSSGYGAPQQPGYSQPGYAQPGYAAPGGTYPGYAPYPGPQPSAGWDGPSIAALVTAIFGLGFVPVILGIIGLRRTKKNGTQGKWMALVGVIYGGLQLLVYVALAIAIPLAISHENAQERAELDRLHASCAAGVMDDCDNLYYESDIDSEEEAFAETCGGITTDSGGVCYLQDEDFGTDDSTQDDSSSDDAQSYGDDATLDTLWDACEAGDPDSCDDLYWQAPLGSEYEEFGETCGNRTTTYEYCDEIM